MKCINLIESFSLQLLIGSPILNPTEKGVGKSTGLLLKVCIKGVIQDKTKRNYILVVIFHGQIKCVFTTLRLLPPPNQL